MTKLEHCDRCCGKIATRVVGSISWHIAEDGQIACPNCVCPAEWHADLSCAVVGPDEKLLQASTRTMWESASAAEQRLGGPPGHPGPDDRRRALEVTGEVVPAGLQKATPASPRLSVPRRPPRSRIRTRVRPPEWSPGCPGLRGRAGARARKVRRGPRTSGAQASTFAAEGQLRAAGRPSVWFGSSWCGSWCETSRQNHEARWHW
jgi:hypothetical protein